MRSHNEKLRLFCFERTFEFFVDIADADLGIRMNTGVFRPFHENVHLLSRVLFQRIHDFASIDGIFICRRKQRRNNVQKVNASVVVCGQTHGIIESRVRGGKKSTGQRILVIVII